MGHPLRDLHGIWRPIAVALFLLAAAGVAGAIRMKGI